MSRNFTNSEARLARAVAAIPLGTQTFSKSYTQYPRGISPYFVTHGDGCRVWDVDGNEYIDCVSALAAILLGYNDPDVNHAVQAQLEKGTIFSLAHTIELEVAEKLIELIPCAEKVRFGKNGSDATAGAIRAARAYTNREHVAVCGYHGWQDWYIGSTSKSRGVPEAVQALTHRFCYNDIASLEQLFAQYPQKIAAVIMEPMNAVEPQPGFLNQVRDLAHQHGALLIFDETITGFRYAVGGAQDYFNVTPDLATFGKGLANGLPLSAVVGREDVMEVFEDIFFSFTYGGETLSLAAAKASLDKLSDGKVVQHLHQEGAYLKQQLASIIQDAKVSHIFNLSGHPSWSFLNVSDHPNANGWLTKTYLIQEMLQQGILVLGAHNMTYSHQKADIDQILKAYATVLPRFAYHLQANTLKAQLKCEVLTPLFKVR